MTNSPCNNTCAVDNESGFCVGCRRTQDEITNWFHYTEKQKKKVIFDIKERNKKY